MAWSAVLACTPTRSPDREPRPSQPAAAAHASAPALPSATQPALALPPGVLAEIVGAHGTVRVEQRGSLRVLTIDGIVQGAASVDQALPPSAGDPIVQLARLARPAAKSALVVGLGTGATASELARAGLHVEVAELDPAVIDLARRFFSYEGHASAADGLAYARDSKQLFDLVVVDAFQAGKTPPHLSTPDALRTFRSRRVPGGLIVFRLLGSPRDSTTQSLWQRFGDRFRLALGSGAAQESQNLLLLGSDMPVTIEDGSALSLWPVEMGQDQLASTPGDPGSLAPGAAERRVTVMGYLARTEDGTLFIDMPHYEMGGVRYALGKDAAPALRDLLPKAARFPTQGDIRTDGDTSNTLRSALGGGGVKRSDVRFSPVAVKVRGIVRLRSVIDPDAWMGAPRPGGAGPWNPLLPYGGVLYEIREPELLWSLQARTWQTVRASQLAPIARRAAVACSQGKLAQAAVLTQEYSELARQRLGEPVEQTAALADMRTLSLSLQSASAAERPGASPSSIARACDAASPANSSGDSDVSRDADLVRGALVRCALRFYETSALQDQGEAARSSARRLLALLQAQEETPAVKRTLRAIHQRHGDLDPLSEAPRSD